jgi:hypothetical protein
MSATEMMVTTTLAQFMPSATNVHASSVSPFAVRKAEEKLKALLMPESCWKIISVSEMASARRTAGLVAAARRIGSALGTSGDSSAAGSGTKPPEYPLSLPSSDVVELVDEERERGPGVNELRSQARAHGAALSSEHTGEAGSGHRGCAHLVRCTPVSMR